MNKPFKGTKKLHVFLICLGLVLMGSGSVARRFDFNINSRYFDFASGIGGAVIGFSSVFLYKLSRKPETVEMEKIYDNDERLIKIREKSAYGTFSVTFICLLVAIYVFLVLDMYPALITAICVLAAHVGSYFVFYRINGKKL